MADRRALAARDRHAEGSGKAVQAVEDKVALPNSLIALFEVREREALLST